MKTTTASLLVALACCTAQANPAPKASVWADPETALREDPDFAIQGEYLTPGDGAKTGVQVIAMGDGRFDAYLLAGGLPGAGWEPGNTRTPLQGTRDGGTTKLTDKAGKTTATLRDGKLTLTESGKTLELTRIDRQSPTLGAEPPAGALVLFDGTTADAWENGKIVDGHLQATNCTTKQQFNDYTLHLEFRTPYMPAATGQQRGNSGIYHSGRWETQILDSFGLEGIENECGGIYSIAKPRLNMCLPPLTWQTYDVDFTAAKFDAEGKRTAWPHITVKLNGVLIHENLELRRDFTPAAPLSKPLDATGGPVFLQNHSNPVVFRNIWIVPGGLD